MKKNRNNDLSLCRGQAVLIAAIFFLLISSVVIFGIAIPISKQIAVASDLFKSKESFFLAEGGLEDVFYRLANGYEVLSSEQLNFGDYNVNIAITDAGQNKVIVAEADRGSYFRKIKSELFLGEGSSFNYAVQSGNGGFRIEGGATVNGNIYSNGDVIGLSGVTVTGSVVAASSPTAFPDQSNSTPSTPPNNLVFGSSNGNQDFAQSFRLSESGAIYKARMYMRKSGNPSNITVKIAFDNNGLPGAMVSGAQVTLPAGSVGTSYGWVEVVFGSQPYIQSDTTYWLVLDKANNSGSYTIGANTDYASGVGKVGRFGSTWNDTFPSGLDGYFEIFIDGFVSKIEGEGGSQWYQPFNINGDSWANTIIQTRTYGTMYCQNSINNYPGPSGTPCDTSRADPAPQGFPISDSNIQSWKDEVSDSISNSDLWEQSETMTVPWNGINKNTPLKVNGNLTISCNNGYQAVFSDLLVTGNMSIGSSCTTIINGFLKVNGNLSMSGGNTNILMPAKTVWVDGNVDFGTKKFKLHSSYLGDSGIILVGGRANIGGSFVFEGSGQPTSYPILVSTSLCPFDASCGGNPAISVAGSAGAAVVVAPYGTLRLAGGSGVKAMVAHRIEISGSGEVNYESGLADITFSSGPSGGWNVLNWREIE